MSKKTCFSILAALGMLLGASFAQACTLGAWTGGSTGAAEAGGPTSDGAADNIERYSGFCAMQVAGAGTVEDLSPGSELEMITRFYFFAGSGSGVIYRTFQDADGDPSNGEADNEVYSVSYDGANVSVDATAAGGTATAGIPINAGAWNSVEIHWESDAQMRVWVNVDATTAAESATANSGSSDIDAAQLGVLSGDADLLFDDYEARRTTAIGRLLAADSNDNAAISIADAVTVLLELGGTLAPGRPDCNENGNVTIADAVCTLLLL